MKLRGTVVESLMTTGLARASRVAVFADAKVPSQPVGTFSPTPPSQRASAEGREALWRGSASAGTERADGLKQRSTRQCALPAASV